MCGTVAGVRSVTFFDCFREKSWLRVAPILTSDCADCWCRRDRKRQGQNVRHRQCRKIHRLMGLDAFCTLAFCQGRSMGLELYH